MAEEHNIITNNTESVTNSDQLTNIEERILTIRGIQIILDRDLADLYNVETKRLNEQVRRNILRFPDNFRFQLTQNEFRELVANCDRFKSLKHSSACPFAFTEQGVAMLASVLRSETAIRVSIRIMDAFVSMRHFLINNADIFKRFSTIEYHQLEMLRHQQEADKRIDEVFRILDEGSVQPRQGIFYDGQIYDAYTFVADLIKSAKKSILLIDNYVDETVLTVLDKRENGVTADIYTQQISHQLQLDINKHNSQYPPINVNVFQKAHDRFLCIDNIVYHIGASIKDLGKKWFAFAKMDVLTPTELVAKINQ